LLQEPLRDLSVSRATFTWGIPVPGDEKHVMYVWFDALTNYLSGIEYGSGGKDGFWPCDVHLIGKDIIWFHCIIWPALLLSLGIPLPRCVLAHGFVHGSDGRHQLDQFTRKKEVAPSFGAQSACWLSGAR